MNGIELPADRSPHPAAREASPPNVTALPHTTPNAVDVQRDVIALLERAGLRMAPSGVTVADQATLGRGADVDGLSTAERIYAGTESQLGRRLPPRARLALQQSTELITLVETVESASRLDASALVGVNSASLPPVRPVSPSLTPELALGAESFAANINGAGDEVLFATLGKNSLEGLSADVLLAAFLKLNINDPNNSVETHNKMHELSSNMREMALREAQKRMEVANQLMKEAQDSGGYASAFGIISQILSIVSLVMGPAMAVAQQIAQQVAQQIAQQLAQNVAQQMVQSLTQQQAQQLIQNLTQEQVQSLVQSLTEQQTQQLFSMTKDQLMQMPQDQLQQMMQQHAQEMLQSMSREQAQQLLQNLSGKQAQQLIQSLSKDQVSQLAQQLPQDQAQQLIQHHQTLNSNPAFNTKLESVKSNIKLATAGAQAGSQVGQAKAQNDAAQKALDAQEARNNADRHRLVADMHQNQIEEEAEIIKDIMTTKNQVVDSVLQMMSRSFVTNQRIISLSATR